jgi:hypothetical protein
MVGFNSWWQHLVNYPKSVTHFKLYPYQPFYRCLGHIPSKYALASDEEVCPKGASPRKLQKIESTYQASLIDSKLSNFFLGFSFLSTGDIINTLLLLLCTSLVAVCFKILKFACNKQNISDAKVLIDSFNPFHFILNPLLNPTSNAVCS